MTSASEITLDAATAAEAPLLGNLLELYVHDLSAVFSSVVLGPDGRFGYPKLPLYWSEPDRRFPFLIRCGGDVAGFALATRGSPAADDPAVFDVAEFFVLRRYRSHGVGRRAALLLWHQLPGTWTVRVAEANRGARAFWERVVTDVAGDAAKLSTHVRGHMSWQIYTFDSAVVQDTSRERETDDHP
jgi:predicted acetyltransferase